MKRAIPLLLNIVAILLTFLSASVYADTTPFNADFISGYGLRNLETAVVIHADPATPSAGDTVHFTVESPVYDLTHSDIAWVVNGATTSSGVGVIGTDVPVDSQGTPLDASVVVTNEVWGIATSHIIIVPLQVDILYDAPSYVAPFYRGRALPSAGSVMRLQAVARFIVEGVPLEDSDITYTWKRNGTTLGSISGPGRSSVTIASPALYGTDVISVRASANNDTLSSASSITIRGASPVLALYEDHPLFGIMFHQKLPAEITQPTDITVAAVPYFAPALSLEDPNLQYSWLLNSSPVTASSTKRNEVTLRAQGTAVPLHLEIVHAINFFFSVSGDWKFIFGGSAGTGNAGAVRTDAFHTSQ